MSSLNSLFKTGDILVADTSVVINIVATGFAARIASALPCPILVTANALEEIIAGTKRGHDDFLKMQTLIDQALLKVGSLGDLGSEIYRSLVEGSALTTLDDGEAATIAHAIETGGVALIDERKARSLCAKVFPQIHVISTAELLLHESVAEALGPTSHVRAVVNALQHARMRVPTDFLDLVVRLIGEKQAVCCTSLPAAARASNVRQNSLRHLRD